MQTGGGLQHSTGELNLFSLKGHLHASEGFRGHSNHIKETESYTERKNAAPVIKIAILDS